MTVKGNTHFLYVVRSITIIVALAKKDNSVYNSDDLLIITNFYSEMAYTYNEQGSGNQNINDFNCSL